MNFKFIALLGSVLVLDRAVYYYPRIFRLSTIDKSVTSGQLYYDYLKSNGWYQPYIKVIGEYEVEVGSESLVFPIRIRIDEFRTHIWVTVHTNYFNWIIPTLKSIASR